MPNGLLKDGIYYYDLSIDSILTEIKHQLPQLMQAKAIIMDMRGYPKTYLGPLISQLLTHRFITDGIYCTDLLQRIR